MCKVDANPTTRKSFDLSESQESPVRNTANMKLLHLRNRWKSRVKKFRGSPQARRHSNQGSLRSPGTPIPEETNYWVPAWLDGAPGHQCIGWEMQSATKLVPQSTFSNYSDRPCKARLWVFEGVSVTFTSMRVPASNCGNQALMSFAINKFLLAKFAIKTWHMFVWMQR